jgi:hypothetical protein
MCNSKLSLSCTPKSVYTYFFWNKSTSFLGILWTKQTIELREFVKNNLPILIILFPLLSVNLFLNNPLFLT